MPQHPDYLPGKNEDGSPEDDEKEYSRQLTVAADGEIIPLAYGEVQTKGKVFTAVLDAGYWYVGVLWCEGEIESIDKIWADDIIIWPYTDPDWVDYNVSVVNYTGETVPTPQGVDPWLAAAIPGYADDLIMTIGGETHGIAYSVVRFIEASDPPLATEKAVTTNFNCALKGLKIPPTGDQTDFKAYSTNPSRCLADFVTSKFHGEGKEINTASVVECAAVNDELVLMPDGLTYITRNTINLVIDTISDTDSHRSNLQRYAACFYTHVDGEVKLIPDRPRATDATFDNSNIVSGSAKLQQRGMRTAATSMRVSFTNTFDVFDVATDTWTTGYATYTASSADTGNAPWRESSIGMLGLNNYNEAYNAAYEQLNKILYTNNDFTFLAFDDGIKIQMGDVISVSHPIGLVENLFRVVSAVPNSAGRYKITAYTYDETVYLEPTAYEPVAPEPPPNPASVPSLVGTQVWEECFWMGQYWATVVRVSWAAVVVDVPFTYVVRIDTDLHGHEDSWTTNLSTRSSHFTSVGGFINFGTTANIKITETGDTGTPVYNHMTRVPDDTVYGNGRIYGPTFPPDRVENLVQTVVGSPGVANVFTWDATESVGGIVYEVQIFENGTGHNWDDTWERIRFETGITDLTFSYTTGFTGTYEFMIKAINVLDNYNYVESKLTFVVA